MDKTAIKNFSIWARNKLIADITYKAGLLGITGEGIKDALPQSTKEAEFYDIGTKEPYQITGNEIKQRRQLVEIIKRKAQSLEYRESYLNVMEEVAYTWFNRLIAIRFMEVNDYMPAHVRVLSSESGTKLEPDLVTNPFDAELAFTSEEEQMILKMKNENAVNELFQFLFIRQCNALNAYLPKLFENTADYTELLLHVSVTDQDGIVYHLVHDIAEKDFNITEGGQVEIIGWMYQYYNTEPKDETFALLKKNVKITKERIPAATQLFTPDWIVRYMVENSLGRLWLEGHPNDKVNSAGGERGGGLDQDLRKGWKYYLDEAEQETDVAAQLEEIRKEYENIKPEDIKIIDPCMGSGHILVYAFDVLMQIYESYGYSRRDAAKSILLHNIYGLDIDNRAFQLAYFAIMMKARQYNRRILTQGIEPNLCAIQESNGLKADIDRGNFLLSEEHRETLQYLLDVFVDAKEYGSILEVENRDYAGFLKAWEQAKEQTVEDVVMILWYSELNAVVPTLAKQAVMLAQKYDVVVTNPPYMASGGMNSKLLKYIKKHFPDNKSDLYAVFINKCMDYMKQFAYSSMITQHTWMFLSRYEKMRENFQSRFSSMVHLGARAFDEISGEVVQTVAFVLSRKNVNGYIGNYIRLVDYYGEEAKEKEFFEMSNKYKAVQDAFMSMPGSPVAYWVTKSELKAFGIGKKLKDIAVPRVGLITGNNERFIRNWWEINCNDICFSIENYDQSITSDAKWYPYNKGGTIRKWYGNRELVVYFKNGGEDIVKNGEVTGCFYFLGAQDVFFKEGITWNGLASNRNTFRFSPVGTLFDSNKGPMLFPSSIHDVYYLLGFFNTKVTQRFLNIFNPSISLQAGDFEKLPVLYANNRREVEKASKECVVLSKLEWDAYEISTDFLGHPLCKDSSISRAYDKWKSRCEEDFNIVHRNEEYINVVFIQTYGLEEELNSAVDEGDITYRKADLQRDIKSLLSYAVGCMFGRYSLKQEGLMFAGGNMEDVYQFHTGKMDGSFTYNGIFPMNGKPYYYLEGDDYLINGENIIPLTDEEYLEDDIISLLCIWLKKAYGENTLEKNLDFIAKALGNKGNTSREVIRNYFLKEFFKDHCKIYQKRPIYWLFDSGKQNGFKALIYLHRYNADTIGNLRVDYLHRMQRVYDNEISRMQDTIDNSDVAREVTAATKRREKLQKQLKECQEYDEKIGHLALSRIEIDLDDGVKVNYEKVQTARDGKKYQVLAKI